MLKSYILLVHLCYNIAIIFEKCLFHLFLLSMLATIPIIKHFWLRYLEVKFFAVYSLNYFFFFFWYSQCLFHFHHSCLDHHNFWHIYQAFWIKKSRVILMTKEKEGNLWMHRVKTICKCLLYKLYLRQN